MESGRMAIRTAWVSSLSQTAAATTATGAMAVSMALVSCQCPFETLDAHTKLVTNGVSNHATEQLLRRIGV